jgi:hypothetical protein
MDTVWIITMDEVYEIDGVWATDQLARQWCESQEGRLLDWTRDVDQDLTVVLTADAGRCTWVIRGMPVLH